MINIYRNRIAVSDMTKGTLKQVWFFIACLLVVTYLNASSKFSSHTENGMFMYDIHGVVYECNKPNLVNEGLCRDYGRVTRTENGVLLYTQNEVKHITYDKKPLISKKPVGREMVEISNSNEKMLSRVMY